MSSKKKIFIFGTEYAAINIIIFWVEIFGLFSCPTIYKCVDNIRLWYC